MVPVSFHDFFATSAGAGAALVGLLFVAVSIAPELTVKRTAPVKRQVVATSTFTAMLNAFFISLVALLPGVNLGIIVLILGAFAFANSMMLGWYLLRQRQRSGKSSKRSAMPSFILILVGLGLYGYELYQGFGLLVPPNDTGIVRVLASIIVAVYGLGLTRAWELLGAQRYNLLSYISVLRDVDDQGDGEPSPQGR
ncbi:MAG: hypothetical protein ACLQUY_05750 [Ktedonobacterales bacterium]